MHLGFCPALIQMLAKRRFGQVESVLLPVHLLGHHMLHYSSFSHITIYFFSRKNREFDKKQLHGKQCSWDITTQCQQAWHNHPGISVFLISKKHPLILYPQLKLPMRQDTPDFGFVFLTGEIKPARRAMNKQCLL